MWNPILDDHPRTKVYLGIISDVQDQLAAYRSKLDGPQKHYASIDSARDSFGRDGDRDVELRRRAYAFGGDLTVRRIEVGDPVFFELAATDPRGRDVTWRGYSLPNHALAMTVDSYAKPMMEKVGPRLRVEWKPTAAEVGELRQIIFTVANNSPYHRHRSWDDGCMFIFNVSPPVTLIPHRN
jgi:hypothetical protein